MKKKWRVSAELITDYEIIVEADNAEEAYLAARNADFDEFIDLSYSGDWTLSSEVEEVVNERP